MTRCFVSWTVFSTHRVMVGNRVAQDVLRLVARACRVLACDLCGADCAEGLGEGLSYLVVVCLEPADSFGGGVEAAQ